MTSLLTRLEQANGGDRELDILIGKIFPPKKIQSDGSWFERDDFARYPAVTYSVDAALSLAARVLPGWSYEVRKSGFGNGQASVWNPMKAPNHQPPIRCDHAHSPALALVIAIIRAHGGSK